MKSKLIILLLILFGFSLSAQIPPNYYQSAQGLNGTALKTALYNIIKGHRQYQYTADTTDVWDILKQTDRDPTDSANVIEIYTGWSVNAAQEYNNGNGWEREHVWAKVHGGFDTNPPCGTDVHHLRPINSSVNSARNSRWFSTCTTPYLVGGVTSTGCYTSSSLYVWQPRNEDKGDVARMIFYMATRYEGFNGEPDLEVVDSIPSNNNDPSPIMAKLSVLLQWNIDDPVDNWEIRRNDIIYYKFQHNRNPYIDHPEYVDLIWGPNSIDEKKAESKIEVFPNPTNDLINIVVGDKYIGSEFTITDIMGRVVLSGILCNETKIIKLNNFEKGLYLFKIKLYNNLVVKIFKN